METLPGRFFPKWQTKRSTLIQVDLMGIFSGILIRFNSFGFAYNIVLSMET
jgi:hypothetical protein